MKVGGVVLGVGLFIGLIAIIVALLPESMEGQLKKMFDSIPQAPEFGSSFWDWQVNLNKWGELEDNVKDRVYFILTKPEESDSEYAKYVYKYPSSTYFSYVDQLKTTIGEDEGNYYGQVVDGVPHGMGRYINRIGQIWEGQFKDGKFDGFMRQVFESGSHRLGLIKDNEWVVEKNQSFDYYHEEIFVP